MNLKKRKKCLGIFKRKNKKYEEIYFNVCVFLPQFTLLDLLRKRNQLLNQAKVFINAWLVQVWLTSDLLLQFRYFLLPDGLLLRKKLNKLVPYLLNFADILKNRKVVANEKNWSCQGCKNLIFKSKETCKNKSLPLYEFEVNFFYKIMPW